MSRYNLAKSTTTVSLGRVASYGLSFIRNLILARTLAKTDFGLAAAFATTITLLEIGSRMSFGQQIIQSKYGQTVEFQSTSHSFLCVSGVISAGLIFTFSHPFAIAFSMQDQTWAFSALAIIPLLNGFQHLDHYRFQRDFNFIPNIAIELIPQFIVTCATWFLVLWLKDFKTILWILIGKAFLGVLITHIVAKRTYRLSWNRKYVRSIVLFGWPLILNGLLIFASQQADQIIVGSILSLEDLARYALAFSLTSIPWFVLAQVSSTIMLPLLSQSQDDPKEFRKHTRLCFEISAITGSAMLLPLIMMGEDIVTLFYGSKYTNCGSIVAILGAVTAIKFLRLTPAISAMAKADTLNQLYSNILRSSSLPLALLSAFYFKNVISIALSILLSEVLATILSIILINRRHSIPLNDIVKPVVWLVSVLSVGVIYSFNYSYHTSFIITIVLSGTIIATFILTTKFIFPDSFQKLTRLMGK